MMQCTISFGFCNSCGLCFSSPITAIIGFSLSVSGAAYLIRSGKKDHDTQGDGILPLYHKHPIQSGSDQTRQSTARLVFVIGLLLVSPTLRSFLQSHQYEDIIDVGSQPTPIMECQHVTYVSNPTESSASVSCPLEFPIMSGCFGYTPDRNNFHGDISVRGSATTCSSFSSLDSQTPNKTDGTSVWASAQCCRLLHPQGISEVALKTRMIRSFNTTAACPEETTLIGCSTRGNYAVAGIEYTSNGCEAKAESSSHTLTETSAICATISSANSSQSNPSYAVSCLTINGVSKEANEPVEAVCPSGYEMSDCSTWDRYPIRGSKMHTRSVGSQSSTVCSGHGFDPTSNVRVSARCCHVIIDEEY